MCVLEEQRSEAGLVRHHRPDHVVWSFAMERKRFEKRRDVEQNFCELARQREGSVGDFYVLGGEPDTMDRYIPDLLHFGQLSVESKRYHVERILIRVEPLGRSPATGEAIGNFLDSKLCPADIRRIGERKYEDPLHPVRNLARATRARRAWGRAISNGVHAFFFNDSIYSLTVFCGFQPNSFSMREVSITDSMRFPFLSGSIVILSVNIFAKSSTEYDSGEPMPYSSPCPFSPTIKSPRARSE